MKPGLLCDYLETLTTLTQKEEIHQTLRDGLKTRHIVKLLFLYASVLRISKLLQELVVIWPSDGESVKTTSTLQGDSMDAKVHEQQASSYLLTIVTQWRPHIPSTQPLTNNLQDSDASYKVKPGGQKDDLFVLLVMKWALSTVSDTMTQHHLQMALTFVKEVVSKSRSIQDSLADGIADISRDIVDMLLALYTRQAWYDDTIKPAVNLILMQLVSRDGTCGDGVKTEYHEPLNMCAQLPTNKGECTFTFFFFYILSLIKQLLERYQILIKLPPISHIHKVFDFFKYPWKKIVQLLLPLLPVVSR